MGSDQQMHVVRHECIGMQLSACLRKRLSEPMQIRKTLLIAKETRFAVMATLYDVQRDIIQVNARCRRGINPFYHKIIEPGAFSIPLRTPAPDLSLPASASGYRSCDRPP